MPALITPEDRIFVPATSAYGSAICRGLQRAGYTNLLTATRAELDLEDGPAVQHWFADQTRCGGAGRREGGNCGQQQLPGRLSAEEHQDPNQCDRNGMAIRGAATAVSGQQPHLPPSSPTSRSVRRPCSAVHWNPRMNGMRSPKSRAEAREALRKQHGFDAISLMPTNLYGPGDNYHRENSHVLPALIRRFHEAAEANAPTVAAGAQAPLREFLHVDDLGEACVFALQRWQPGAKDPPFLNVGIGVDLSIRELAEAVAEVTGYRGTILWDTSKPDGTPKKQLDVSRLAALGWRARIPLSQGLASTVADFREQLSQQLVRL